MSQGEKHRLHDLWSPSPFRGGAGGAVVAVDPADEETIGIHCRESRPRALRRRRIPEARVTDVDRLLLDLVAGKPGDGARCDGEQADGGMSRYRAAWTVASRSTPRPASCPGSPYRRRERRAKADHSDFTQSRRSA